MTEDGRVVVSRRRATVVQRAEESGRRIQELQRNTAAGNAAPAWPSTHRSRYLIRGLTGASVGLSLERWPPGMAGAPTSWPDVPGRDAARCSTWRREPSRVPRKQALFHSLGAPIKPA